MKTTETKINVRVDKKVKEKAQKTFEALGLDLSSGVKLFLHSVINTQSIPFEIRTANGYTAVQEAQMIKESKKALKEYKSNKQKGFKTAEDMHKYLLK